MASRKRPPLSDGETRILTLVWQLERATVREVCDELPDNWDITYATVQTLLRRLEKKGYLAHEVEGKSHVFFASVEKEQVVKRTVGDFVDRLFGGEVMPLMLHLAKAGRLKKSDIDRLKKLIDEEGSS